MLGWRRETPWELDQQCRSLVGRIWPLTTRARGYQKLIFWFFTTLAVWHPLRVRNKKLWSMTESLESGKREIKKDKKKREGQRRLGVDKKKKWIMVPTDIVRSLCVRLEAWNAVWVRSAVSYTCWANLATYDTCSKISEINFFLLHTRCGVYWKKGTKKLLCMTKSLESG